MNVPELRFPEFSGEWEEKKLGHNCKFFSGGTPSTSKREYYIGNIPFIKSGEINNYSTEQMISEEGLDNSSTKLIKKGDLLFALYGATSGEVAISKIDGAINQAVLKIDTKANNHFLYNYFLKDKDKITSTYLQGGQGNLSAKIVKSLSLSFPSLPEQDKIASFLSKVDEKIGFLEKKRQFWKTYKKGIMQKIFSQELRFKDENGENFLDWEEKKLVDMLKLIRNGFSGNQVNHVTNFPVTRIETISSGKINFNKVGYVSKIDKSYKLQEGDILISNINSVQHIGKLAYFNSEKPLYHGMNLLLLRFNKNYDKRFLYYFLSFYKKWFEKMCCQAVNQASINQDTIKKFPAIIPKNIGEQQKISDFLLVTENKIAKTEYELKLFNNFKKGLLQQMFI